MPRSDAWIVQREVSDPVEYVQLWLRDAAEPNEGARAQAWLDWFDAVKAEAVGFGIVTLRRNGHANPVVRARLRRAPGLRLTQEATHDEDDWAVSRQYVTLPDGLRWSEEVDPVALARISGADGTTALGDQLAVLAAAFDTPSLTALAGPVVAHLLERGFLDTAD